MRTTVASLKSEFDAFRAEQTAHNAQILALLEDLKPAAPAKPVTRKATKARKAPAKKAAPVTKGTQTRETLSRKDWNRTLTTLAKTQPKGSGAYALVIASWADMQEARDAGMTPREALALVIG